MKQIHSLDKQIETRNLTDHHSVIHGYRRAREFNLDLMILHEFGLYQSEVPAIVESLRRNGIKQVALTHAYSNIMGIIWEFAKAGATLKADLIDTGEKETFGTPRTVDGCVITLN